MNGRAGLALGVVALATLAVTGWLLRDDGPPGQDPAVVAVEERDDVGDADLPTAATGPASSLGAPVPDEGIAPADEGATPGEAAPAPPDEEPSGGVVSGVVRDTRGDPVVGALVSADTHGGFGPGHDTLELAVRGLRSAPDLGGPVTDAEGRFVRDGLRPGRARLVVVHPDHEPLQERDVLVGTRDLLLVLEPAAVVRVTVVDDATGAAIDDATVRVFRETGRQGFMSMVELPLDVAPRAGRPGAFRAAGAGPHDNRIEVAAPGHASTITHTGGLVPGERRDVVVRLVEHAVLRGRVVDAAGAPVPGATVLHVRPPGRLASDRTSVESGEDGRFRMEGLPPKRATLSVWKRGHVRVDGLEFEPTGGGVVDIGDLVLPVAGTITGTLYDVDGRPVPDTRMWAQHLREDLLRNGTYWQATTDEDGRFAIDDLPPGQVHVRAPRGAEELLSLGLSETMDVTLRQRGVPVVHGRVTSGGQPVAGAFVRAIAVRDGGTGEERTAGPDTRTDESGEYALVIETVDPWGHSEVHAWAPGGGRSAPRDVEPAWDERHRLDFTIGSGSLAGRLVRPGGAALAADELEGVVVRLAQDGRADGLSGFSSQSMPTPEPAAPGVGGSFRFAPLDAGTYRLHVEGPGVADVEAGPFELGADEARVDLVVELPRAARLTGTVLDVDGVPTRRSLFLHPVDARSPLFRPTVRDGRFEVGALAPGRWRLVASDSRYRAALDDATGATPFPEVHGETEVEIREGEEHEVVLQLVH